MSRILAIDYGTKRIGLAVSDPLQIIAGALDTVATNQIWQYLATYMQKETVSIIVVGYPKRLDNTADEMTKPVEQFVKKLNIKYPNIKIELIDERFTSKLALQAMIEGGMKQKDRRNKANIDKISATIILQAYMQKNNTRPL